MLSSVEFGTLVIQLEKINGVGAPSSATGLVTEQQSFPLGNAQFTIAIPNGGKGTHLLKPGTYSITIFAAGHDPFRTQGLISAGKVTSINARLTPRKRGPLSFAERLQKYGLTLDDVKVPELTVEQGKTLSLDPKSQQFTASVREKTLKTIDDVKKIVGHADEYWLRDQSRFANAVLPNMAGDPQTKLPSELAAAFREYVYGNSQTVTKWKDTLNNWMTTSELYWPIFFWNVVTVGPNAVLEVGASGLTCDVLRVHLTGTIRVVGTGPTAIETGTYEQFA